MIFGYHYPVLHVPLQQAVDSLDYSLQFVRSVELLIC